MEVRDGELVMETELGRIRLPADVYFEVARLIKV
jgi:hypothetical protein